MTKEQEAEIRATAPDLFRASAAPSPFTQRGFETAAGWFLLVLDTSRKLQAEIERLPFGDRSLYVATQVKSKFGRLRFYLTRGTLKMFEIIEEAEARSGHLCETCGEAGKRSSEGGGVCTACETHLPSPNGG